MGADARWVCHTCKTVCPRGGRLLTRPILDTQLEIRSAKDLLAGLNSLIDLEDIHDDVINFLDDLDRWLQRHEGHEIHIGSDYSTDMMELKEYHNETVDGQVDKRTRFENSLLAERYTEAETVEIIQKIIEEYAANPSETSSKEVARDLYNRFFIPEI